MENKQIRNQIQQIKTGLYCLENNKKKSVEDICKRRDERIFSKINKKSTIRVF